MLHKPRGILIPRVKLISLDPFLHVLSQDIETTRFPAFRSVWRAESGGLFQRRKLGIGLQLKHGLLYAWLTLGFIHMIN